MSRRAASVIGAVIMCQILLARPQAGLVSVTVAIVTKDGKSAGPVAPSDLVAELDGMPAIVESAVEGPEPLNMVLMVDQSGSMFALRDVMASAASADPRLAAPKLTQVTSFPAELRDDVLNGFLPALAPSDRARLGRVTATTTLSDPITHERKALANTIDALYIGLHASSPIWDGTARAVEVIAGEPGRRLVILVTDGQANSNTLMVEDLAERAVRAHVAVSIVDEGRADLIKQDESRKLVLRSDRALRWLADATGGFYLPDEALLGRAKQNPGRLIAQAIETHRRAYSVSIRVPDATKTMALRISIKKPGFDVHAPAFVPAIR